MTDEKAPDYLTVEVMHEGKLINTDNPRARYQVNVNVILIGSKHKPLK